MLKYKMFCDTVEARYTNPPLIRPDGGRIEEVSSTFKNFQKDILAILRDICG